MTFMQSDFNKINCNTTQTEFIRMEKKMKLSISTCDFLDAFEPIIEKSIDENCTKNLNLFMIKTNANEFAYDELIDKLLDPVIDFTLSRKTRAEYDGQPGKLSKMARQKFRKVCENKGELGELLIYCFLESHLNAPKILSKYELKTSANDYVKGSDGVHFLELESGDYQLIFCESKTYLNIGTAISDAFSSIKNFKENSNGVGGNKPGLTIEKSLISSHLGQETFSDEESVFMKQLIYPKRDAFFEIDNAFAVFIGYEMKISEVDKGMTNANFRNKLKTDIQKYVENYIEKITTEIKNNGLLGHSFYLYILPFTDLDASRERILMEVVQ